MTSNVTSSVHAGERGFNSRALAIFVAILSVLLIWIFWDFLFRQVKWAYLMPADWGHTLVIPLIAGYFVYLRRDALLARPFKTTWIGFIPILLGIAWYMICVFGPQVFWHHNLRGIAFGATLFGLVLLFCGWRATMILLFPLAYLLLFGQTISDRFMEIVTFKLQIATARGSAVVMQVMGMDIQRQGNTLFLWETGKDQPIPLNIAEACSGMRMLMAFLALGVAIAYTGLKRFWQRAILVLLAIPTAVVVNIMRVVTLAQLGRLDSNFTTGEFHTFVGLVWLVPAFLIYLGLVWIIRHIVVEPQPGASTRGTSSEGADRSDRPSSNRKPEQGA